MLSVGPGTRSNAMECNTLTLAANLHNTLFLDEHLMLPYGYSEACLRVDRAARRRAPYVGCEHALYWVSRWASYTQKNIDSLCRRTN